MKKRFETDTSPVPRRVSAGREAAELAGGGVLALDGLKSDRGRQGQTDGRVQRCVKSHLLLTIIGNLVTQCSPYHIIEWIMRCHYSEHCTLRN